MPNVILVGRHNMGITDQISEVVTNLGIKPEEGVITECDSWYCVDMTNNHNDSPYLIVRDTDPGECKKIAEALNEALNIDVEFEVIDGFLSRKGEVFSKPE